MENSTNPSFAASAFAIVLLASTLATAQQPVFYPAQGQSPEKQSQDRMACQSWATQQVGASPGASAGPPPPRVGGRARGAAAGAAGAAITGNDPAAGPQQARWVAPQPSA